MRSRRRPSTCGTYPARRQRPLASRVGWECAWQRGRWCAVAFCHCRCVPLPFVSLPFLLAARPRRDRRAVNLNGLTRTMTGLILPPPLPNTYSCFYVCHRRSPDLGVISIALKAASHCYGRDDRSRLAELCFGILANIACLPAGADELTEVPCLSV